MTKTTISTASETAAKILYIFGRGMAPRYDIPMILKAFRQRIGESLHDNQRVFGLDLMRAVAILMVLFAHCSWIIGERGGVFSQVLALFGFLGVEVFFVLSGFLIGRILYRLFLGGISFRSITDFLRRRWFRTLPNYFLVLAINIAIAFIVGYEINYAWRYFVFMQNFAWPLMPFFPESWSLSVEEFAYLILPFVLFAAASFFSARKSRLFILTILVLIAACILAKAGYHAKNGQTSLEYWNIALKSVVVFRLDAIFTGVAFSWLSIERKDFWQSSVGPMTVTGVVMILFFTAGIGLLGLTNSNYPLFWNVFYLPLASLSIALFLPLLSQWTTRPWYWKPVVFISIISYSIYLLHYSIVLQSMKQFADTEQLPAPFQFSFAIVYIMITIVLSASLYAYFEKPMMDRRERPNR